MGSYESNIVRSALHIGWCGAFFIVKRKTMINLSNEDLKKLQKIELEMMLELDRICEKYNIAYTIIGGTLIGAVRNKGFIPWDDDVDIAMLRPEYEKFREACIKELDPNRFYFQDDRYTEGYRWGYGKIRRKDTQFVREHQEHMPYEQGVFLDVFPHDYVPNNIILRRLHCFRCFIIRKALWSEIGRDVDKSRVKRMVYSWLSKIDLKTVKRSLNNLVKDSNKQNTNYVRALMFPTFGSDCGYNSEWFEPGEKMEFEGHMFQCMKGAHEYLSYSYGDYMKLPPEEDRKVHPVSILELIDVKV